MSRTGWIALLFSLIAGFSAYRVGSNIYEGVPHLEDEIAYVWQARAMAGGHLTIPSPEFPDNFLVPFVVDYQGQRFGKYPLGWPALLSIGIRLNARALVNPLLTVLIVWFTFRLGQKLLGDLVGLLAAFLTLASPFLYLNAGSLLSHPMALLMSTVFVLFWWAAFGDSKGSASLLRASVAGLVLGVFALTRPYTALGVSFPFLVYGMYLLIRGPISVRKQVIVFGITTGLVASLQFAWQYAASGDPFLNLYTLWWPYDKVGFGLGYGVLAEGHSLRVALSNARSSLWHGELELFGWHRYSWIFVPFGLWFIFRKRDKRSILTASAFFSLVVFYMAYWIGSRLFGPRYWFEGLYSLTLLTAVGIAGLAGWPLQPGEPVQRLNGWRMARPLGSTAVLALLVTTNLVFYIGPRLEMMRGLYGITAAQTDPFRTPEMQALTPAIVFVHADYWTEYGGLLELEDPFLTSPFIFIFDGSRTMVRRLREIYPDREIFVFDPDIPSRIRQLDK